jgi:AcrR family transcriptional regulator
MAARNNPMPEAEGNTRERILKAAEEIFSRKGYDAARVEEIVQEAGVNKALLFYYFRSKENVFRELIRESMRRTIDALDDAMSGVIERDRQKVDALVEEFVNFLLSQKKLLKMIMIEAMKDQEKNQFFMEFIDPILDAMKSRYHGDRKDVTDAEYKLRMFFVNTAPIITYIVLGEKWAEFYRLDRAETDAQIVAMMKKLQGDYLMS